MNYIKRLEAENAWRAAIITAMEEELHEVRRYLESSKFHVDPTVQVRDVMNRLDNVWRGATDVINRGAEAYAPPREKLFKGD